MTFDTVLVLALNDHALRPKIVTIFSMCWTARSVWLVLAITAPNDMMAGPATRITLLHCITCNVL